MVTAARARSADSAAAWRCLPPCGLEVGADFPVGCRMLAEDCIESGSTVEDAEYFAERLARAGMDFISLSRGGKFEDASQPKDRRGRVPLHGPQRLRVHAVVLFGCERALWPQRRCVVRASARKCAAPGSTRPSCSPAAYIISTRPSRRCAAARLTSSDSPARRSPIRIGFVKVREGRGAKVRLCLYTNYCEALDQRHREVTCELWDRTNLDEPGIMLSADGKRRLLPP